MKKKKKKKNITDKKPSFFTFLKQNVTFILIGLYSLSFINHYIFYNSFGIPIFNYIGLNDMLFFSLEYIFRILLLILISEILFVFLFTFLFSIYEKIVIFLIKRKGYLYLKAKKSDRERIKNIFEKKFKNYLPSFGFGLVFILVFVVSFSSYKVILLPTILIYFLYYIERISDDSGWDISLIMGSIVILLSMTITPIVKSYEKRFEKDEDKISFYENSTLISTDKSVSCLNYLGETSSHIFLYDIENKEAKVYSKDNISDFTIKKTEKIDNYIKKIERFMKTKPFGYNNKEN